MSKIQTSNLQNSYPFWLVYVFMIQRHLDVPRVCIIHLLPFIKEQSMFVRVNRIFDSAFQISIHRPKDHVNEL